MVIRIRRVTHRVGVAMVAEESTVCRRHVTPMAGAVAIAAALVDGGVRKFGLAAPCPGRGSDRGPVIGRMVGAIPDMR
jgi:hypothetical protein